MWQDYVIAFVQTMMTASIIPMIHEKTKPPFKSSIPTAVGCFCISFAVGTLGLWFSMVTAAVAGFLWFILVFQRFQSS